MQEPRHRHTTSTAAGVTVNRWYPLVAILVSACLIGLAVYHVNQLTIPAWRIPVIMVSFLWMCITIVAAFFNRPVRGPAPDLKVGVVIPSRNEDPAMLKAMLASLDVQSILPVSVYFVENGESNGEAERIFREWARQTRIPRTVFMYRREAGKRDAQAAAFAQLLEEARDVDVVCTMDSDTELDPLAILEGLKPFGDPEVTSVAGLLVGKNRATNWLTRIVDMGFVSSFMNGRAAWSSFGSVAVNCGGLAFYRSWVIKKYLPEYVNQTLLNRKVNSGDDRMLTAYAALEGRTLFQETSVGKTLLPENMSHLTRQRGRWWRSFWWGGLWLIRRFRPTRAIWWLVASQYVTFTLYSAMFPLILIYDPIRHTRFPWVFFVYIAGISYLRSARTLAVNRPDQSLKSQLLNFTFIPPLVTLLNLWLCTVLQWWGLLTFYVTDWRTRQQVEVGLETPESAIP
jgi:hyaluronan synthase